MIMSFVMCCNMLKHAPGTHFNKEKTNQFCYIFFKIFFNTFIKKTKKKVVMEMHKCGVEAERKPKGFMI